jgi:hypothetical protein
MLVGVFCGVLEMIRSDSRRDVSVQTYFAILNRTLRRTGTGRQMSIRSVKRFVMPGYISQSSEEMGIWKTYRQRITV